VLTAIEPEWNGGHNGDKRHSVIYDNSKVKQLVPGYCATIPWRVGAERALNTILKDPSLQPQDPAFDKWCDNIISIYDKALADAKAQCGRLY
jgi:hypothetical protein